MKSKLFLPESAHQFQTDDTNFLTWQELRTSNWRGLLPEKSLLIRTKKYRFIVSLCWYYYSLMVQSVKGARSATLRISSAFHFPVQIPETVFRLTPTSLMWVYLMSRQYCAPWPMSKWVVLTCFCYNLLKIAEQFLLLTTCAGSLVSTKYFSLWMDWCQSCTILTKLWFCVFIAVLR